uniref:Glutathione S-transferase n=1 Tax=Cannabis sativa TaxID=3483 RepID=A0A803NVU5_CANSA
MAEEVILLDVRVSMFCLRVKIALAEKGIKCEYIEQDLQNKDPLLLKMNPFHNKVPVLIHNGKSICDSLIILQYIEEVWPEKPPNLLPSDTYQRAQARLLADFTNKIHGCGWKICLWDGEKLEVAKKELVEMLKVIEGELGDKPYFGFGGERFGFVDVALIGFYSWFIVYEMFGKFSMEIEFPKLSAWAKRCLQKESVSKSITDIDGNKTYQYVVQSRKRLLARP